MKKTNALEISKQSIRDKGIADIKDIFCDQLAQKLLPHWIDSQFENVKDGPDQIGFSVKSIEIEEITFNSSNVNVTAIIDKFLIDRVNYNGKYYCDKMEGNVYVKATLINENNKWRTG